MKDVRLRNIVELIGITALVASLIFVGLQLRQAEEATFVELGLAITAIERDELALVFEHADVWVKGNAGEELDTTDATIYAGLMKVAWSRVFWHTISAREIGYNDDAPLHDFAWFLHKNPGARVAWSTFVDDEIEGRSFLISETPEVTHEYPAIIRMDLERLDERKQ